MAGGWGLGGEDECGCVFVCVCALSHGVGGSGIHRALETLDTEVLILVILPVSHQLALDRSLCGSEPVFSDIIKCVGSGLHGLWSWVWIPALLSSGSVILHKHLNCSELY